MELREVQSFLHGQMGFLVAASKNDAISWLHYGHPVVWVEFEHGKIIDIRREPRIIGLFRWFGDR